MMDPIRPADRMEGKRPDRHALARTCSAEGCDVKLSTYNPGPDCYQHSPLRYPRIRGKTKAER